MSPCSRTHVISRGKTVDGRYMAAPAPSSPSPHPQSRHQHTRRPPRHNRTTTQPPSHSLSLPSSSPLPWPSSPTTPSVTRYASVLPELAPLRLAVAMDASFLKGGGAGGLSSSAVALTPAVESVADRRRCLCGLRPWAALYACRHSGTDFPLPPPISPRLASLSPQLRL